MKHLLLLFFSLVITTVCFAQQLVDVVYLKNGGRIRGTIIEQTIGDKLKIQTADGSVFVYTMAEVEKITKESSADSNSSYSNDTKRRINGDNDLFSGKIERVGGDLQINGITLNDQTAIELLGAESYDIIKAAQNAQSLSGWGVLGGGAALACGAFSSLLGAVLDDQPSILTGVILLAVGTVVAVPSLIVNRAKANTIETEIEKYNHSHGYSINLPLPANPIEHREYAYAMMNYQPILSVSIPF